MDHGPMEVRHVRPRAQGRPLPFLALALAAMLTTGLGMASVAHAATCYCPILPEHFLAPRVYDVRAIMESCYISGTYPDPDNCTDADGWLKTAITAVLSTGRSNPYPITSAKTLYFRAGAYRVVEPIAIDRDGVTLRGEAGYYVFDGDTKRGSHFVCDFDPATYSEPCLTLGPATGTAQGMVLEDLAFQNEVGDAVEIPDVTVSLRNLQNPRVRRVTIQAGKTNLAIEGCTGGVLDETWFQDGVPTHVTAIDVRASTGLRIFRAALHGLAKYDYGLRVANADDIVLDQALSHGHGVATIDLADAGRVVVRGLRFENGPLGDVVRISRSSDCSESPGCPTTDLVLADSYFDMACAAGIRPVVVESFASGGVPYPSTAPAPRVYLRGNSFYRVFEEIFDNDEPAAQFQCDGNALFQQAGATGTQWDVHYFTEGSCDDYSGIDFPSPEYCN